MRQESVLYSLAATVGWWWLPLLLARPVYDSVTAYPWSVLITDTDTVPADSQLLTPPPIEPLLSRSGLLAVVVFTMLLLNPGSLLSFRKRGRCALLLTLLTKIFHHWIGLDAIFGPATVCKFPPFHRRFSSPFRFRKNPVTVVGIAWNSRTILLLLQADDALSSDSLSGAAAAATATAGRRGHFEQWVGASAWLWFWLWPLCLAALWLGSVYLASRPQDSIRARRTTMYQGLLSS